MTTQATTMAGAIATGDYDAELGEILDSVLERIAPLTLKDRLKRSRFEVEQYADIPEPVAPVVPPTTPTWPEHRPTPGLCTGDRVRIVGRLRPKYMVGLTGTVRYVNDKTARVVLDDPKAARRFSNPEGVNVPKTCLTLTGDK